LEAFLKTKGADKRKQEVKAKDEKRGDDYEGQFRRRSKKKREVKED